MTKSHFTKTDLLVLIFVFLILTTLLGVYCKETKRRQHPCAFNMKQIGQAMTIYFSDGTENYFPQNTKYAYLNKDSNIVQLFNINEQFLSCPAKRVKNLGSVYAIAQKVQGQHFDKFSTPNSIIAYDGTKTGELDLHKNSNLAFALFGDGHVELIKENFVKR